MTDFPEPFQIDLDKALILLDGQEVTKKNALKKIVVNDVASSNTVQGGEKAEE